MLGSSYRRGDPVPPETIRSAAARICDCEPFRSSPRLIAFLRFIVDAALAGDAESLKAYTIAVGALDRPESFDPSRDAIVRVEALRLRAALERYYSSEGAEDQVVIVLRRGSYAPEFGWRAAADAAPSSADRSPAIAGPVAPRHSVLEERYAVFARCHAHLAQVSGTIEGLKAEFAVAEAIMVHSQRLIAISRREQEAEPVEAAPAPD